MAYVLSQVQKHLIGDLFEDMRDGVLLITLLEVLSHRRFVSLCVSSCVCVSVCVCVFVSECMRLCLCVFAFFLQLLL